MARKERIITIKVIENKNIYDEMLTNFFAKKYIDRENQNRKKKGSTP